MNDTQTNIIASVKAKSADDFDYIGGIQSADIAYVQMIISGASVKGATAMQELNYLTENGDIDIFDRSSLQELVKDQDTKGG